MVKKTQQSKEKKNKQPVSTSIEVKQHQPRYVRVMKILGRTGSRGAVQQVRIEFVEDTARSMVRNVIGPVKVDDILCLMEHEREARRMR